MNKLIFLILAGVLALNGCNRAPQEAPAPLLPDAAAVAHKIKGASELAVVEYRLTKLIQANDDATWWKFGDRVVVLSCEASVKAGILLGAIGPDDVQVNPETKTATVRLPKPRILSVNLEQENVQEEYSNYGIFRDKFSETERQDFLKIAEEQIRAQAETLHIEEEARLRAESQLSALLRMAGFHQVYYR